MNKDIYNRFAPFIIEYIYKNGWNELRPVQIEAARVLFDTDKNLLLSSTTASGKTEAAFFPIISMLSEKDISSFNCIYIAPLKSLINDQFLRLDGLLELSGIPVFHWHGDIAASHKTKALKMPGGILQITPESLESMLMNRSNDIPRLFAKLEYIVIDEIHVLMGSDRGNQIHCQLSRLQKLIGRIPRRVGLSATIGRLDEAALWLGSGTGRETEAPYFKDDRTMWRLALEHFYIDNSDEDQRIEKKPETFLTESPEIKSIVHGNGEELNAQAFIDPGYEYLYDCTKGKKCLVFSNSREETEYVTATLRQIADKRGEPDRFFIHHGNLSAQIREEAETRLRNNEDKLP